MNYRRLLSKDTNHLDLGVGIGLRSVHYDYVMKHRPAVPWFEVISENFMGLRNATERPSLIGGRPLEILKLIRKDYPVMLHGVSLNIGSMDPLRQDYLKRLKNLADQIEPVFVSDHLCWTGVGGENLHDLLPLPYTEEALAHVVERIQRVQDFLKKPFLLENVSSYLSYKQSEMEEWEFLTEVAHRSGCGLLLDINNVYVSAHNHNFNPITYLKGIPAEKVFQMHLAGYSQEDHLLIDTHDHPVSGPVWDLYAAAVRRFTHVPTLIEWDEKIPPFSVLMSEAERAQKVREVEIGKNELAPLSTSV